MKKTIVTIILLPIMLSLFSSCSLLPKEEQVLEPPLIAPQEITYQTIVAQKGNIVAQIKGRGVFRFLKQYDLSFQKRSGYLKDFYFKQGDTVKEGDLIAELDTDSLASQIKRQEIVVRKQEIHYENTKKFGKAIDIELAKLDFEYAKITLEELQTEYDKCSIYAPIDGLIVFMTTIKPGEYIAARASVTTVADPTQIFLTYSGDKVRELGAEGTIVDVTIDDTIYKGKVVSIADIVEGDDVDKKQVVDVVNVVVENLPTTISSGDMADITLTVESKENVLLVPKTAIQSAGGGYFVYVLDDNGIRVERPVTLGITDGINTEIISGITEGETLVLR